MRITLHRHRRTVNNIAVHNSDRSSNYYLLYNIILLVVLYPYDECWRDVLVILHTPRKRCRGVRGGTRRARVTYI